MTSPRRIVLIAVLTPVAVVLALFVASWSYSRLPDSWRYRKEIARAEQAAVKIEAYHREHGRYPDEKDTKAFMAMGLQFDPDFYYANTGKSHCSVDAPLIIFRRGMKGGCYDLVSRRVTLWAASE